MIDIHEYATRAIESPIATPPEIARVEALAARYRRRRGARRTAAGIAATALVVGTAVGLISALGDRGGHVTAGAPTSANTAPGTSPGDTVLAPDLTFDHFVTRLVVAHHVVREGTAPGAPLAAVAHLLCVDNTPMRVYEYPDRAARAAVSDTISPDGSRVGSSRKWSVRWVGPPHFFADGRIIVLVLTDDTRLLAWLPGVLGPTLSPRAHAGPSRDSCKGK